MSDIAKQAANKVLDVTETSVGAAIEVVGGVADLAGAAVTAPVTVAGKTVDAVIEEARGLFAQGMKLLRDVADRVTEPLP